MTDKLYNLINMYVQVFCSAINVLHTLYKVLITNGFKSDFIPAFSKYIRQYYLKRPISYICWQLSIKVPYTFWPNTDSLRNETLYMACLSLCLNIESRKCIDSYKKINPQHLFRGFSAVYMFTRTANSNDLY